MVVRVRSESDNFLDSILLMMAESAELSKANRESGL